MKMDLKKLLSLLFTLLLAVSLVFAFSSCDETEGGGGFGDGNGVKDEDNDGENGWEGIKYSFDLKFTVPDSDTVYTTQGKRDGNKVTIEFTEVALKNHSSYNQLRKSSGFVKYGVYLGGLDIYKEFSALRVLPEDTVVCILRQTVVGKISKDDNYQNELSMFKALLTYSSSGAQE